MDVPSFYGVDLDAVDPDAVARFWAGILGWAYDDATDGIVVHSPRHPGYRITIRATETIKTGQNRIHFDLTSHSHQAMRDTIDHALAHGGRLIDVGQTAADRHEVLADPEGNEFCIIEPDNAFLADTDVIGAVNCDGTRAVGHFWSAALRWPLIWDQDEETAIQAPTGGTKITWSGPPLMTRHGRDRLRLVLAADADGGVGLQRSVDRLVALGATHAELDEGAATMRDPDGNEFRLIAQPGDDEVRVTP